MCECGCSSNDERYTFPAPSRDAFYMLTIAAACPDCDAPPGISIELIDKTNVLWKDYKRGEFIDGKLKFEKWPDSKGVAIVTGMRRHEFVKAVAKHLIGTKANDLADENGLFDDVAAETIAEELYEDSLTRPHFPKTASR